MDRTTTAAAADADADAEQKQNQPATANVQWDMYSDQEDEEDTDEQDEEYDEHGDSFDEEQVLGSTTKQTATRDTASTSAPADTGTDATTQPRSAPTTSSNTSTNASIESSNTAMTSTAKLEDPSDNDSGHNNSASDQHSFDSGTHAEREIAHPTLQVSDYVLRHSVSTQRLVNMHLETIKLKRFRRSSSQRHSASIARQNSGAHPDVIDKDTAALVLLTGLQIAGEGMGSVVQDTFLPCFESQPSERWNWSVHLFIPWLFGVLVRNFILLPLRLMWFVVGLLLFLVCFFLIQLILPKTEWRQRLEARSIRVLASIFVVSWSGVVKYHGTPPDTRKSDGKNPIFVANHTSMIDMAILAQLFTFAVVGQKHGGWVGVLQARVLNCLQSVWFDRGAVRDKMLVRQKLREQVSDVTRNPLLVFPEGTCVNNKYVIQFKQGVFQLDAPIAPVAIRYNDTFVDAFWNSRAESFSSYLIRLMRSWAVVCDVWFLEPQRREADETPAQFADRVKRMIADRAELKVTDWDGYMKHYKPSKRYLEAQQRSIAHVIMEVTGCGTRRRINSFLDLSEGLHHRGAQGPNVHDGSSKH